MFVFLLGSDIWQVYCKATLMVFICVLSLYLMKEALFLYENITWSAKCYIQSFGLNQPLSLFIFIYFYYFQHVLSVIEILCRGNMFYMCGKSYDTHQMKHKLCTTLSQECVHVII